MQPRTPPRALRAVVALLALVAPSACKEDQAALPPGVTRADVERAQREHAEAARRPDAPPAPLATAIWLNDGPGVPTVTITGPLVPSWERQIGLASGATDLTVEFDAQGPAGAALTVAGRKLTLSAGAGKLAVPLLALFPDLPVSAADNFVDDRDATLAAKIPVTLERGAEQLVVELDATLALGDLNRTIGYWAKGVQRGALELPARGSGLPVVLVPDNVFHEKNIIGDAGATMRDLVYIAYAEATTTHEDGICYGYEDRRTKVGASVRRVRVDERWTVYDARSGKVVETRDFKARKEPCPEFNLGDRAVASPSRDMIEAWLRGFTRPAPR